MKRWLILLALTACSPQLNIAPECPQIAVKEWTAGEQHQILAEEKKLPGDSILISVLMDYAKLRREVR